MSPAPVAVIDIGSNSIKVLVALRAADGGILPLHSHTLDVRISAGISRNDPHLGAEGMARGVEAIRSLLADADRFPASRRVLVATSAVRDARNGADFCKLVRNATGHEIRILTGREEANLIGRGLACDPALRHLRDFYVFDLGGGSLECLGFRGRHIEQSVSLQLGCVRLTEKFSSDSSLPLTASACDEVSAYTRKLLTRSDFAFSLPAGTVAVGTGGTVTTVRAILGAREGKPVAATPMLVTVAQLRELLAWLGAMSLAERKQVAGLPPSRADVFPVALATLLATFELGGLPACQNSLYNLRYGLADEALAS